MCYWKWTDHIEYLFPSKLLYEACKFLFHVFLKFPQDPSHLLPRSRCDHKPPIKHLIRQSVDQYDSKQQQTHPGASVIFSNTLAAEVDIGIVGSYTSLVLHGSLVIVILLIRNYLFWNIHYICIIHASLQLYFNHALYKTIMYFAFSKLC